MDALAAIADPVRRDILTMLRSGPRGAGAIAAEFPISRPAISRHLRVLREAGLVVEQPDADPTDGRARVYRLDVTPLAEVDAWLAPFRTGWGPTLDALATEVHRTKRERRRARAGTASANPDERRPRRTS